MILDPDVLADRARLHAASSAFCHNESRALDDLLAHVGLDARELVGRMCDLKLGIRTQRDERAAHIAAAIPIGNIHLDRNMIGAVVSVQAFGSPSLSSTAPKADGPHSRLRFAAEKVL